MSSAGQPKNYDIADVSLAEKGRFRMQWAGKEMPVLDLLEERWKSASAANAPLKAYAWPQRCTSPARRPT